MSTPSDDYDPFRRGPHPAGTRTLSWTDAARERTLPVDVWYPATEAHAGQDLDPETMDRYRSLPMAPEVEQQAVRDAQPLPGVFPLVIFSHGFGGERRQTTHLCTHLASHGYVVAAMDHVGNTTTDMMLAAASGPPDVGLVDTFVADRPADASFVIDCLLEGHAGLEIDPERIGIAGHSFGGWTTLVTANRDPRIKAALPLAPAGGRAEGSPLGVADKIADALFFDPQRRVATLFLFADQDTLLPLEGMHDLLDRMPERAPAVVLRNADHFHFCDRVEQTHDLFKSMGAMLAGAGEPPPGMPDGRALVEGMKPSSDLCPGEHAYALTRGLGLAQFDAHLRALAAAEALLAGDLAKLMADRGVDVEVI